MDKINSKIKIDNLKNPRNELEEHYYNPSNDKFIKLGLKPHLFNDELIISFYKFVKNYKNVINKNIIDPKISWSK